jgi:hypothetical protein
MSNHDDFEEPCCEPDFDYQLGIHVHSEGCTRRDEPEGDTE